MLKRGTSGEEVEGRTKSKHSGSNIPIIRRGAKQPIRTDKGSGVRLERSQQTRAVNRPSGALLIEASYIDDDGRKWITLVPPGREEDAAIGIPVGPPGTSILGLPEEVDVRLNNQLFNRKLLKWSDVKKRPMEVNAAVAAAYKVDSTRIMNLYREVDKDDT